MLLASHREAEAILRLNRRGTTAYYLEYNKRDVREHPRFPAMLDQPFDDALVACNQLYNLPARFFHLNADATEIADILGDYYENEVAHFFKLYDTILHFDDDVIQCTMVDLIDETGDGPECRSRHCTDYLFLLRVQCTGDNQSIFTD